MKDIEGRRIEAAGDAACLWHTLDRVLPTLRRVRDELEDAGLEDLAEGLRGPVEEIEVRYDGAGRQVAEFLGDASG